MGRYDRALEIYEAVLPVKIAHFGREDHISVAITKTKYGYSIRANGSL